MKRTSDFGEYLEGMADNEQQAEPNTVADLLDEIEDEKIQIGKAANDSQQQKQPYGTFR